MTIEERDALLAASIAVDPADTRSRRYALRRTVAGIELFDVKHTGTVGGEEEFHGHPASWVPARILRRFRDSGDLSQAEYQVLARTMGSRP
jgi:hypothetical protein